MIYKTFLGVEITIPVRDLEKNNVVYKLTFPSGKVYIGQTVQKFKERLYKHCRYLDINNKKSNAVRKYKKFKAEVIYEGCSSNQLDDFERIFIELYNSVEKGYNLDYGGITNKIRSKETREKISINTKLAMQSEDVRAKMRNSLLGRKLSEEHKKKLSDINKGKTLSEEHKKKIGESHRGMIHSEESKRKMSEHNKGRFGHLNSNSTPIIVINISTNEEIRFECIMAAGRYYNIDRCSISKACRGVIKTFYKKQYTARYEN